MTQFNFPPLPLTEWKATRDTITAYAQVLGKVRRAMTPKQKHWWLIPDQDPDNEEYADEQMNFGFSTGDEGTPDAYFYVTAYPTPDEFAAQPLPAAARWQTEGYTGAILPYQALIESNPPIKRVHNL